MSLTLCIAMVVAFLGFVLLLQPEAIWRLFQKDEDKELSTGIAACMRLGGIIIMVLSVIVADLM